MNTSEISREQWLALAKEHQESNLTQKEFCDKNNLSLVKFGYYVQIYRKQNLPAVSRPASFSEVLAHSKLTPEPKEIKIELPNGFKCQVNADINSEQFKKILGALLSC